MCILEGEHQEAVPARGDRKIVLKGPLVSEVVSNGRDRELCE